MLLAREATVWYEHWKEGHVDYPDGNWNIHSTSFFGRHIQLQLQDKNENSIKNVVWKWTHVNCNILFSFTFILLSIAREIQ